MCRYVIRTVAVTAVSLLLLVDLVRADVSLPVTDIRGHNNRPNYAGKMECMTNWSGMNIVAPTDPSTWTCISTAYGYEWPGRSPLDFATYGKVGWVVFDLGATKNNLQDLYIWNGRENTTVSWETSNVYYATSPTVTPPVAPTDAANTNYDFTSGGWTKVNSSPLVLPSNRNASPDAVIDLGGVSARYVAMEAISRRNTGDRCALAEIAITQTDSTPPTLASSDIVDDQGGGPIEANVIVTYTLTFSEDIDNSTVSSSDFDNGAASPSTISILSITETNYGVYVIEVQPLNPGNLQLRVPSGATIDDLSANALGSLPILDDTTITVNADVTDPTLASSDIVDDRSGAPVPAGDMVTYTITFSEDIDDSTVTSADFSNAGSSSLSFGSITETAPGVFTVQVTPTTGGTLQLQVSAGASIEDLATNYLDTTSAIVDDTTITVDAVNPTLAGSDIVDNKSGGPIRQYEMVTYTVTFSEDIDDTTVTSADFGNAGTATVAFGNVLETSAGVFAVQVHVTTTGSLQLRVNAGAVIEDVAGNTLDTSSAIADNTTLTVSSGAGTLAPIVDITAYHQGQSAVPGIGSIVTAIDGSGMTKGDELDPSTWSLTTNSWYWEWQAKALLNSASSYNNKIGWLAFDLGSSTAGLQDLYLWNCYNGSTAGIQDYNIYYSESPSVSLPSPTGTATDYDFSSAGWTKFNPSIPMYLPIRSADIYPERIINLEGITARYVAIEILTNYGNTGRAGIAEIGLTFQAPPATGTMFMFY